MRAYSIIVSCITVLSMFLAGLPAHVAAEPIANDPFMRTWSRTDQPVASGAVSRTWMWGPEALTAGDWEAYAESPGGTRFVQYFDKSRMEITNPGAPDDGLWYVTNGLLVVEMMTGQMQTGNTVFIQRAPAGVNVAGDPDDTLGPTYATFQAVTPVTAGHAQQAIVQVLSRDGTVSVDQGKASYGVPTAEFVDDTQHWIAGPFWDFMNATGMIFDGNANRQDKLFQNPFYATGLPVSDPYWVSVKVGGLARDVLVQCFERRCLTYTPSNDPAWQVEMGNVGRHYYAWRYGGGGPSQQANDLATAVYAATDDDARYAALLDVMDALNVGVYTGSGQQVLGGAERGPADFYLYDIELRMMAGAIGRGQTWGVADLAMQLSMMGFAPEGEIIDPEATRQAILRAVAASRTTPAEASSLPPLLVRQLGLEEDDPYDLFTNPSLDAIRFDALGFFILLAGASVPAMQDDLSLVSGASDLVAQSNGVLTSASTQNPCDPSARFDGDAVKDAWSWAKIFGDLVGLYGEAIASGGAVLDAVHGAVLSFSVGVTSLDSRLETHYGHDTPGAPLQFRVKVEMRDDLPEFMIRCGWIAGTDYPPQGPIANVSVHWFWPGLGEHGDVSCGSVCAPFLESGLSIDATGPDGIATLHFQPRNELSPGTGWIVEEYGVVTGIALYQSRFTNLLGSYAQYLTPKSGTTAWSVRWHETPGYIVTIRGQYEMQGTMSFYSSKTAHSGSGSATWTVFIPAEATIYPYQTTMRYSAHGSGTYQRSGTSQCSGTYSGTWTGTTIMHHDYRHGENLRFVDLDVKPAPMANYQYSGKDCHWAEGDWAFDTARRQHLYVDLHNPGVQTLVHDSDPACTQYLLNTGVTCEVESTWTITVEFQGESQAATVPAADSALLE